MMKSYSLIFLCLTLLAASGCARHRDLTVKFVDATTGQPLAGVTSIRQIGVGQPHIPLGYPVTIYFSVSGDEGEQSSADGIVEYKEFDRAQKLEFTKEGYGRVLLDRAWPWPKMRHAPEYESVYAQLEGDVIVVPLAKEGEEESLQTGTLAEHVEQLSDEE